MTLTDAIMVAEKTGSAKTLKRGGNAAGAKARDKRKTERGVLGDVRTRTAFDRPPIRLDRRANWLLR